MSICADTVCSRHDLSRHDLFKTRSVKTHFTMLVSVSHPMPTPPVTEYVAPAPADTHAARYPAIEYVAPTPVVTYAAPSSVIEYVKSVPVVLYAAPATVIQHSTLQRIGHQHEHTWKRRKISDDAMHLFFPV